MTDALKWRPLNRNERRLAGVLVEKAKTTPEQYPLTANGLVNGSNQKNNRDQQMQLEEDAVNEALDSLRAAGAVVEMQGGGRVAKYRHLLYDWLGVEKVELAVMAELLLRGAQTEGELRGRAARMEPILDLTALRGVLDSLRAKKLVIDITPPGRGQIVSHNLYLPEELDRLKQKFAGHVSDESAEPAPAVRQPSPAASGAAPSAAIGSRMADDVQLLRAELAEVRRQLESLSETVRRQQETIEKLTS